MRLKILLILFALISMAITAMDIESDNDLYNLPTDIVHQVFRNMDYQSAVSLILVNKKFYLLFAHNESSWKSLFLNLHGSALPDVKSYKKLCWSLSKNIKMVSANIGRFQTQSTQTVPYAHYECVKVDKTDSIKTLMRDCLSRQPKVLCFPYFLSTVAQRHSQEADNFVDICLKEASNNDVVVVLKDQPLNNTYPHVIRVHCSNKLAIDKAEITPQGSAILRYEPPCEGCAVEKLAKLIIGLRSIRRDLSAKQICSLLEKSSTSYVNQENLKVKKVDEESAVRAVLGFCGE